MRSRARIGVALVKAATVYLLVGLLLGMAMAAGKDYRLVSVHSHLLLLGWATLAMTGLVYLVFPRCAASRLARAHFWLLNAGLPAMLASLAADALGAPRAEPFIAAGSVAVIVSLGLFTLNVLRNAGSEEDSGEGRSMNKDRPRSQ